MILKSPPITIFPCIHTTHHTNIHSHTFTRFGQPHSDVQNITQSTLPACTHTLHTRHKSRFAAPAQIFTLKTAITYAGQENNRHSPFDVVLMSLQEKPLVEGYYSHLLHTHTHWIIPISISAGYQKGYHTAKKLGVDGITCTYCTYICTYIQYLQVHVN